MKSFGGHIGDLPLFSLVFRVGLPGTAFPPESCLLDFGILTWEVVRKHGSGWSESNVSCLSPTLFSCRRTRDGKGERNGKGGTTESRTARQKELF